MSYSVNLLPTFGLAHLSDWDILENISFDSNDNMVMNSNALATASAGISTAAPKQLCVQFGANSKGTSVEVYLIYKDTGAAGAAIECPLNSSTEICIEVPSLELRDVTPSATNNVIVTMHHRSASTANPATIPQINVYLLY